MLPTFLEISREIRNRENPGYLYWTLLVQQRLLCGLVLTPTDFQHLPNCLSQSRTKLYCSEISSKLFPDYHDRRTTKRTCSNVYSHSDFPIVIEKFSYKRN
ncbi:hypothetical protein T07_12473 [Trichinella nelsoni]|uniref:Uncharacterized protein n=1 Tax=Trichinella nelsoni TaxID=6336 RepID=A0A0V0SIZ6_9BILA|nr:hypothetical protein T07_12473 [Trichinella nelsoni]